MKRVWKFAFPHKERFTIDLPAGAHVIHADDQGSSHMLWAVVDDTAPMVPRSFALIGTGHEIDLSASSHLIGACHVSTWSKDSFVWHLFDITHLG